MPCTTFVSDSDFQQPDHPAIAEWIHEASKRLGCRIGIARADALRGRWPFRKRERLYGVLLDLGHGQAQVINFAPREGSDWSINQYVPAQEVAAYLMGIATARAAGVDE